MFLLLINPRVILQHGTTITTDMHTHEISTSGGPIRRCPTLLHNRIPLPQNWQYHNLLTCSMVRSPSWEANWFAASQEILRISRNPKVHYRTHKRPPPVPTLGQPNPVHIPTSHLLEIHPNIIHPSMPRSPEWPPSLRFPQQDPIHPPLLTHMRHMPSPSHYKVHYTWGKSFTLLLLLLTLLLCHFSVRCWRCTRQTINP